ncbi:hypothetical protein [Natrinema versiforme]|uniref:Uncharacterized protein n=1 Tax=Natrinema versiforme JCM 10478 TaxID=1227496 RepID=L9YAA0_9EURY|nr:hypothetical protein [Natrinema versiforme]ELY70980.1 hypothetical protein C489_01441 [Natrinema versiforme JCM 10478]
MSLDRHAAERRRFARLLGTDGDHGSGLPIGGRDADEEADDRDAVDDDDRSSDDAATTPADR